MARNQVQFQKGLSEASFAEIYGTEEQFHAALVKWRWPNGFECPGCKGADHCVVTRGARRLFQCNACRKQTSVKAGTIFASSKLPLRIWFKTIYLVKLPYVIVATFLVAGWAAISGQVPATIATPISAVLSIVAIYLKQTA